MAQQANACSIEQLLVVRYQIFMNWVPIELIPLAKQINFVLLYLSFRNFSIAATIISAVPVSFAGGAIAFAVAGVD